MIRRKHLYALLAVGAVLFELDVLFAYVAEHVRPAFLGFDDMVTPLMTTTDFVTRS
jgi:hypothetical protein